MLEKSDNKVSINIKISSELDLRLKNARSLAKEKGYKLNVSHEVEKFLLREIEKVEMSLSVDDIQSNTQTTTESMPK